MPLPSTPQESIIDSHHLHSFGLPLVQFWALENDIFEDTLALKRRRLAYLLSPLACTTSLHGLGCPLVNNANAACFFLGYLSITFN